MAVLFQDGPRLSPRQQAILTAIVEQYLQTGEPVASHGLAAASGLSSATIRNVMAELVDAGYLEQPHTSAGRVPTAGAFRLHVEQLRGGNRLAPAMLAAQSRTAIEARLQGMSGEAFLERTSQLLAGLSRGVGVAMATLQGNDPMEHVHFQRLATRRVLAVVVTRSGVVRDRVLMLEQEMQAAELEAAARYLNENFRGWTVEGIRTEIACRAATERDAYQEMRAAAEELWTATVLDAAPVHTVFVEGVSNLLADSVDRGRLREMLAALEAKERVMALLHAYLGVEHARAAAGDSVRVVFDMESHAPEMQGLVLVAAPAVSGGAQMGAVGVIGPQRMDYETTINAVHYVAQLFAETQRAM
ncbi:heat-inducible transcriptional repressor HrcA [Terriglobus sp.]|uniref:heat-inducible transcriptional repressor HrcA n=1 Tax=Terriglobus sp. TaxID=1889013 RepID=UPI003B006683